MLLQLRGMVGGVSGGPEYRLRTQGSTIGVWLVGSCIRPGQGTFPGISGVLSRGAYLGLLFSLIFLSPLRGARKVERTILNSRFLTEMEKQISTPSRKIEAPGAPYPDLPANYRLR